MIIWDLARDVIDMQDLDSAMIVRIVVSSDEASDGLDQKPDSESSTSCRDAYA